MSRDPAMPRFRSAPGVNGFATPPENRHHHGHSPGPLSQSHHAPGATTDGDGDDTASPPRSRLRRAAGVMFTPILLIVAVVGGHRAWTAHAERRLAQYVEALRQAGEPVLVDELMLPAVSDRDNAALELCIAARALDASDPRWRPYFMQGPPRLPMTAEQFQNVRAVLDLNREALAHVTLAAHKPGLDWAPVVNSPWSEETPYYMLRGQGIYRLDTLANLLFASALAAHVQGDEPAALDRVDELLFLARAVSARRTLSAYSYSLGREEAALSAIGHILPDLRIGDGPDQVPAARVAALIARLSDPGPYREALVRNARVERARQIESFMPPAQGASGDFGAADPWGSLPSSLQLRPSFKRVALQPVRLSAEHGALLDLDRSIAALRTDDAGRMLASFGEHPQTGGSGHDGAFVRSVSAAVYGTVHNHVRSLARRQATAVALACYLYRHDNGDWPPAGQLSVLVPRYLRELPADPFAPAGQPLAYAAGPARPRVYSVGVDGIDDGGGGYGALALDVPGPRLPDLVVDLQRQPLPPIVQMSMFDEDEEADTGEPVTP